jgi:hypothetical protein
MLGWTVEIDKLWATQFARKLYLLVWYLFDAQRHRNRAPKTATLHRSNKLRSCSLIVCAHEEILSPSFVAFQWFLLRTSSLLLSLSVFVVGPHSIVIVCVCRRPSQHGIQSRQIHANRWYWFSLCATERYCRSLLSYDHDSFLLSAYACGVKSFAFELSLFFVVCFFLFCSPRLSFVCGVVLGSVVLCSSVFS